MSVERELTYADVVKLQFLPVGRSTPPALQRIKPEHHIIARGLAAGNSAKDVAISIGYTPQRVRDLTLDPTFNEILTYYTEQIAEANISDAQRLQNKLLMVAEMATDEIIDRLDDPEIRRKTPLGELRQLAVTGADRTVAPPKAAIQGGLTVIPTKVTLNIGRRDSAQEPKPAVVELDDYSDLS